MNKGVKFLALVFLLVLAVPTAQASAATYFAMKPDKVFCITVMFGEDGRGEYTLTVSDPDYPRRGWVDNHRTSFTSGPSNPIIVPVCFNTNRRRIGENVMLRMTLETPEAVTAQDYGVCVSNYEDADVVEKSENPCEATSIHTDLFSAGLVETEKYAVPGQRVTFTLLVSSEFNMEVLLDKTSGPSMQIGSTSVQLPGEHSIDISMEAPSQAGDYPFTLKAAVSGCNLTSCVRDIMGVLHVSQAGAAATQGFTVELSPKNKNIMGTQTATFTLSVHNFDAAQTYSMGIEIDSRLNTDFSPQQARIERGWTKTIDFSIAAESSGNSFYVIKAYALNEQGEKKVSESFLTVEEPVSDAKRVAESVPKFSDQANDYSDSYSSDQNLDDWMEMNDAARDAIGSGDQPEPQPEGLNWIFIVLAAAGISLIVYFIYKKTHVYHEVPLTYYRY